MPVNKKNTSKTSKKKKNRKKFRWLRIMLEVIGIMTLVGALSLGIFIHHYGLERTKTIFAKIYCKIYQNEEKNLKPIMVPITTKPFGIDASIYQGTMDWDKVEIETLTGKKKVQFAYIKATESTNSDWLYNYHRKGTQRNRIVSGAYHVMHPWIDGTEQARYYMKTANLNPSDLPPALDLEMEYLEKSEKKVGKEKTLKNIIDWLRVVEEESHCKPIIYSSVNAFTGILNTLALDKYDRWVARYSITKSPSIDWSFWQFSCKGKVTGVSINYVDLNLWNGTEASLEEWRKSHWKTVGEEMSAKTQATKKENASKEKKTRNKKATNSKHTEKK